MVSRAELTRMGRMGFSEEDYAEWLKRRITRREDIQAHEVTLRKMAEAGATGRKEMEETGLGKRQRAKFGFERPEQAARIGEIGARTARDVYGLEFEKGVEPTLKTLVKQKGELGALDIEVLKKELAGPAGAVPGVKKKTVAKPGVAPTGVAKPGERRMRPSVKKLLWGDPRGDRTKFPGILAPARGWMNLGQWLKHFTEKGYEYAFPRSK